VQDLELLDAVCSTDAILAVHRVDHKLFKQYLVYMALYKRSWYTPSVHTVWTIFPSLAVNYSQRISHVLKLISLDSHSHTGKVSG